MQKMESKMKKETKQERRERIKRNRSKMVVQGRSVFQHIELDKRRNEKNEKRK